jgi:cell division protein ZapA
VSEDAGSVISVRIYNQQYDVRSEDPEFVRELAAELDQKMNEVSQQTPTVDTLKVAILAALNIIGEHQSTRHQLEHLRDEVAERSKRMLEKIQKHSSSESPDGSV